MEANTNGSTLVQSKDCERPVRVLVVDKPQQTQQSSSNTVSPRFHTTSLQDRVGKPYTTAEIIMIGYLAERTKLSWSEIDRKMARGHNTCATKHTKQPYGLKYPKMKTKLCWEERSHAIDALLKTIDLDMEQLVDYLQRFIDTGMLPKEAANEFDHIHGPIISPTATFPGIVDHAAVDIRHPPVPTVVSTVTSKDRDDYHKQQRSYDRHEDIIETSSRLRPNARLTEGQLHVKSMFRKECTPTVTTPDSLLDVDTESEASMYRTHEEQEISRSLFDIDDDEYASDTYVQRKRPYLSLRERKILNEALKNELGGALSWASVTVHEDFRVREIRAIEQAIQDVCPMMNISELIHATRAEISAIVSCATSYATMKSRTRSSIHSFLKDASMGHTHVSPERLRIDYKRPRPLKMPGSERSAQLLRREIGYKSSHRAIQHNVYDKLAVTRCFTGASGDVGSVAWSPSDRRFAAGSACLVDSSSMQYNRPNNLLLGYVDDNMLYELPDHHTKRQKPDKGANSTQSMHASQDSRLFETVSMVDFARDGSFMFSVGYDNHLRAYSTRRLTSLHSDFHHDHGDKIDLLCVNAHHDLLATGCANVEKGIKLFHYGSGGLSLVNEYTSPRAKELRNKVIIPSALKWGIHPSVSNYLLAGFSTSVGDGAITTIASGEICLWDIEHQKQIQVLPAAGNTFDCAWSHGGARFATAVAAYGTNLNRGTKSIIRVYDPSSGPEGTRWTTHGLQLECPALDINDVVFSPYNQDHITAGATDGSVYVWDIRRPDHILHTLSHGDAVMELDEYLSKEKTDTGVRFCSWGHDRNHLYTGSSDGVVKIWDVHRAPEDVHRIDVASFNSGVMSGAFNQDFSALLIGEVNGSIDLLEIGKKPTRSRKDIQNFLLQSYVPSEIERNTEPEDSGIAAARSLIRQQAIEVQPLGGYPIRQAVQGRRYDGPYDQAMDAPKLRSEAEQFQERIRIRSSSQCTNASCQNSARKYGKESSDSERWKDRVPQVMRDVKDQVGVNDVNITMFSCVHCGTPARAREDDLSQAIFPRCERCAFGCLRCGDSIKISALVDKVICKSCGLTWDIGTLGYLAQYQDGHETATRKKTTLNKAASGNGEGLDDLEDLLHLVEDYYHSLWEDPNTSNKLA